jgi:two-component system sensor histidine kinase/response regulator
MDGYVSKPVKINELETAILAAMGWAPAGSAGGNLSTGTAPPASARITMDLPSILERLGGDEKLLDEVIGIFIDEAPRHLKNLGEALASGDFEAVERSAHSLKGELGYLGIEEILRKARDLERLGRDRDLARAGEIYMSFATDMDAVIAGLRAFEHSAASAPKARP